MAERSGKKSKSKGKERARRAPADPAGHQSPPEDFRVEVDPDRVDEAVRSLFERLRTLVEQGMHVKVRLKYKGKPLMGDIPLGVFVATEVASFWVAGILRALVFNLGMGTFLEVEFVHDAEERVRRGVELYAQGDVEEAEEAFRQALEMRPDDPSALYHLGVLLRVTGRRTDALECLEKAAKAKTHPDAARAREALRKMKRGARTL